MTLHALRRAARAALIVGGSAVAMSQAGVDVLPFAVRLAVAQEAGPISTPAAANQQFAAAVALHNRQAWDLAADEWGRFIKDFPNDPRVSAARHYLGMCRMQLKDYAGASAVLQQLVAADAKFELIASATLNLGMAQFNLAQAGKADQFAAAEKTFAGLLRDHPQGKHVPQAVYFLAESLYAQKKFAAAEPHYARFVKEFAKDPLAPDALYAYGFLLEELGKAEAAQGAYESFVQNYPQHALRAEVDLRRADLLMAAGDAAAAEPLFAAAAASANFADADYALVRQAGALYDQKKFAAAAGVYDQVLARFPKSSRLTVARLGAGRSRYFAGDYDVAVQVLLPLAKLNIEAKENTAIAAVARPDKNLSPTAVKQGGNVTAIPTAYDIPGEACHWAARSLIKSGKPAEAEQLLTSVKAGKETNKFSAQLALDLGDALYDQPKRRDDALKAYQALVDKFPDDKLAAQGRYLCALTALELGRNGDARKFADAYLKSNSGGELTSDVLYIKAEAQLRDGKNSDAAATYDQLLAADTQHADRPKWIVRRAYALAGAGKHDQVVKSLADDVAGLGDKSLAAEARQLLGVSRQALKDYAGAAADLEASVRLDPQRDGADDSLLALSEALRSAGNAAAADAAIDRLAKEYPQSPLLDSAFYRRGESAYAAGNYDAAGAAYRRVLDDYPTSKLAPYARYGLAWAALGRNDAKTASASLDELLKGKPPAELLNKAYYARALAREQSKEYSGAIDDLNAYLKSKPTGTDRSEALYWLGRSQLGAKNEAAALKTFEELLTSDPKYVGAPKVLYEIGWLHKTAGRSKESAAAFARLAKNYPEAPTAAEALFHVGEEAYARKDYQAAVDAFYEAREKATSKELAEKAAYNLGWTYFHRERFDKAEEWFRFQTEQYAGGSLANSARFMLGETLFKQKKWADALAAYKAAEGVTEGDFKTLRLLHGAQAAIQLEQWGDAQTMLNQAAAESPQSPYMAEIN
ncbi:MAG: tetratricopeptide repeat protein, partial [Planctomycetes bacterium]|nr:tetratricopeptide repeat protein [Planctomycetota bacterium]